MARRKKQASVPAGTKKVAKSKKPTPKEKAAPVEGQKKKKKKPAVAKEKKPYIPDWDHSEAKEIIFEDLLRNNISRDKKTDGPAKLWNQRYKDYLAFKHVPYEQFRDALCRHRNQFEAGMERSLEDEADLEHDLQIHKARTHNDRGEPKFAGTDAEKLLRKLIKQKKHKGITHEALRQKHPEFHQFPKKKFSQKIYQEIRYQRFCNWIQVKRDTKRKEHAEKVMKHLKKVEEEKQAKLAAEKAAAEEEEEEED